MATDISNLLVFADNRIFAQWTMGNGFDNDIVWTNTLNEYIFNPSVLIVESLADLQITISLGNRSFTILAGQTSFIPVTDNKFSITDTVFPSADLTKLKFTLSTDAYPERLLDKFSNDANPVNFSYFAGSSVTFFTNDPVSPHPNSDISGGFNNFMSVQYDDTETYYSAGSFGQFAYQIDGYYDELIQGQFNSPQMGLNEAKYERIKDARQVSAPIMAHRLHLRFSAYFANNPVTTSIINFIWRKIAVSGVVSYVPPNVPYKLINIYNSDGTIKTTKKSVQLIIKLDQYHGVKKLDKDLYWLDNPTGFSTFDVFAYWPIGCIPDITGLQGDPDYIAAETRYSVKMQYSTP